MAKRKGKTARGPWKVKFKQVNDKGVGSRPYLVDADGVPVNLNQAANATLAALGPEAVAALIQAGRDATLWINMLRSEHPGVKVPAWLALAEMLSYRFPELQPEAEATT